MQFFDAQKKLVRLWFIWVMLLISLIGYHLLFGVFRYDSSGPIMIFVGLFITPVFTLILGNNFLNDNVFQKEIKSVFIFRLAYFTSIFYLLSFTVAIFAFIKSTSEQFNILMPNAKLLFAFLEIVNGGLLFYFFSNNKK